ncbi:BglG family transcription antiterminator [Erysipelotrichaceae bacterium Oil+RF-744-GAM-WT-6]|uniref:BglG family transcription antiterminator n=1 Tax=Stecheria intestinalis TaxID=2606630 RepID=A0A7X2TG74_9FIRM|nr:BglG family transcription antiterminator [Stecheria intestinalis]MSS58458.1 BglG family transcription antiterminator [Stecheria intestinalis]
MKKREWDLLNLLVQEGTATSSQLAKEIGVSDKTVRTSLSGISSALIGNGAELVSKRGEGYTLRILDINEFERFKMLGKEHTSIPQTPDERVRFLLYKLLVENKPLNYQKICDEWFISDKTLQQDLKKVEEVVKTYDLRLEKKGKKGFYLSGSEISFRELGADQELALLDGIYSTNQIRQIVQNAVIAHSYPVPDYVIETLTQHVIISILRIKQGKYIVSTEKSNVNEREEFLIAGEICENITSLFGLVFPYAEIEYLAFHLIGKETSEKNSNIVLNEEVEKLTSEVISLVNDTFQVDFSKDFDLQMSLELHFQPLLKRLEYGQIMRNPLLQEIKVKFPLAYTMASAAGNLIESKENAKISEDEIGYIALSFELALERQNQKKVKKNILLVCNLGKVSANLMKYRFLENFKDYINTVEMSSANGIGEKDLNKFDYIFTTVPLSINANVPVILVNYFMESGSLNDVRRSFEKSSKANLNSFFSQELFLPHLQAKSKEEALKILCTMLAKKRNVGSILFNEVLAREEVAGTDYAYRSAVPHPIHLVSNKTYVCVGILDNPIEWTIQKVNLIILVSVGKDDKEGIQEFYRSVSSFLMDHSMVDELIKDRNYTKFLANLNKIHKKEG